MDKVFQINLGGIIFTVEETAFEALKKYLEKLQNYFKNNEGASEIIADIEARMAELLQQKMGSNAKTVFMNDINEVIGIMGDIGQMEGGAGEEKTESNNAYQSPKQNFNKKLRRNPYDESLGGVCSGIASYFDIDPVIVRVLFAAATIFYGTGILFYIILWMVIPQAKDDEAEYMRTEKQARTRKLFRNPDEKAIGGVCSGLAHYFGLETVWVRLAFVAAFFFFGSGFLLYVVLWIIIPKAYTAADKLQMRGEPVDVKNIEREMKNTGGTSQPRTQNISKNSGALRGILKFIVGAIAFFFIACIIALLGVCIAAYMGMGDKFWGNELFFMAFGNENMLMVFKTAMVLVIISPILAIVTSLIRLIFSVKFRLRIIFILAGIMFFSGVMMLTYVGVKYATGISKEAKDIKTEYIARADTLYLHIEPVSFDTLEETKKIFINDHRLLINSEGVLIPLRINIKRSNNDSSAFLSIKKTAKGMDMTEAMQNISNFSFSTNVSNNHIYLSPGIWIDKHSAYKFQRVSVKLNVPLETVIVFDNYAKTLLNSDMASSDDARIFRMTNKGLKCLDCSDEENYYDEDTDEDDEAVHFKHKNDKVKISITDDDGENIIISTDENKKSKTKTEKVTKIGPVTIKTETNTDNEKSK